VLLFLAGNDLVVAQKLLLKTKASALAAGGGCGIIGNVHLPMMASIANVIAVAPDQFFSLVVSPGPLYLLRASSPQQLLHPPQAHLLSRLLRVPRSPLDRSHLYEVDL
jgi:hypothetical protein